jgi:hypothetical protein
VPLLLLLLLLLPLAYHVGLLDAHIIQRWSRLSLPLQPVLFVPICLAMPDEHKFCCDSHLATRYKLRVSVDARSRYHNTEIRQPETPAPTSCDEMHWQKQQLPCNEKLHTRAQTVTQAVFRTMNSHILIIYVLGWP